MALGLKGWKRAEGSRFINPKGEEVSRRAYDDARAKASGFKSYRSWQTIKKTPDSDGRNRYHETALFYARRNGITKRKVEQLGSDYNKYYAKTFLNRKGERKRKVKNTLRGPLHDWLVFLGKRSPDAEYITGDTPSTRDDGPELGMGDGEDE